MKKFALCTFLSLSSVLLAQADVQYEISPVIGYNTFDESSKMSSDALYGIRGTLYMNEFYGYRLGYTRADDVKYDTSTSSAKRTDLQRISADLIVSGKEEYNVIPYILLGGGYEMLSNETKNDVSQGFVDGGIGFRYLMSKNVNASLEGMMVKKFDTNDLDYTINLGVGYLFGSFETAPEIEQPSVLDNEPRSQNNISNETGITNKIEKTVIEPIADYEIDKSSNINQELTSIVKKKPTQKTFYDVSYDVSQTENEDYYIQMSALFKSTSDEKKLLSNLDKKGYEGIQKDTVVNNKPTRVILIGPFESSKSAKLELANLKKIKKDAFITKI